MVGENMNITLDGTDWSVLWSKNHLNSSIKPELNLKGPFIHCSTRTFPFFIAQTGGASAADLLPHWCLGEKIRIIEKYSIERERKGNQSQKTIVIYASWDILRSTRVLGVHINSFSPTEGVQKDLIVCLTWGTETFVLIAQGLLPCYTQVIWTAEKQR